VIGLQFVHHVQGQHHWHPQLDKLQREIEVALDVCGVDDIDYPVRLLVADEVPGYYFLLCIGPQRIYARQIHHSAVFLSPYLTGFLIHRDAGEIADMLVGACQGVEKRGLAAVLISGQREYHAAPPSCSTSIFTASATRIVSS